MFPDFRYEMNLWKRGGLVGGLDEVGRGSFAGPVVAAAVVFAPTNSLRLNAKGIVINDSKKLSAWKREASAVWIKKNCLTYGIGKSTVPEINRLGLVRASNNAFRRAVMSANLRLERKGIELFALSFLLVDAFYIPYVKGVQKKNQFPIIKGDTKSISIAAASIVAKVHRDRLMVKLGYSNQFKKYLWHKNKGYGTKEHRKAILKYGTTKHHRHLFVRKYV